MAEKSNEPEPIRVVDRRRFSAEGELRPDAEVPEPTPPTPPTPAPPVSAAAPAAAESEQSRQARQAYERQSGRRPQKMDFETLLMSLYTSAMYQLGLVEDPERGRPPADFENARHTIDMVGVLDEKTRGNLLPREQQLMEQVLYELRAAFVALTTGQKPGAPKAGR